MPCRVVTTPGGARAIVCTSGRRRRCCVCNAPADLLCDWKTPSRRKRTCDQALCSRCTTKPAPDKDLCPSHAREWEAWKARRERSDSPA